MISAIISDDQTQLRRFKGRGKYELYLHNKVFREQLADAGFQCPDELLALSVSPGKRIISKKYDYLKMLQNILAHIAKYQLLRSPQALMESLQAYTEDIRQRFALDVELPPERRDEILAEAWRSLEDQLLSSR
ncbi:MAG: hypothetical protein H6618_07995 [Deltaproteobacteria bacterium]|nr:hypothetical protein [Deltaproteobacteria bacterium]